jgi:hypothetical protein
MKDFLYSVFSLVTLVSTPAALSGTPKRRSLLGRDRLKILAIQTIKTHKYHHQSSGFASTGGSHQDL